MSFGQFAFNQVIPHCAPFGAIIVAIAFRQLTGASTRPVVALQVPNGVAHHVQLIWCQVLHATILAHHPPTPTRQAIARDSAVRLPYRRSNSRKRRTVTTADR